MSSWNSVPERAETTSTVPKWLATPPTRRNKRIISFSPDFSIRIANTPTSPLKRERKSKSSGMKSTAEGVGGIFVNEFDKESPTFPEEATHEENRSEIRDMSALERIIAVAEGRSLNSATSGRDFNYESLWRSYEEKISAISRMKNRKSEHSPQENDWFGMQHMQNNWQQRRQHFDAIQKQREDRMEEEVHELIHGISIDWKRPIVLGELTTERRDLLARALDSKQNPAEVLVSKYRIEMTREMLLLLRPRKWLNDEVVNFYCAMLADELPRVHAMKTFFPLKLFGENLNSYNYAGVRRWTRRIDIFSLKVLLIPINLPLHWVLAAINFDKKRFEYYDSLSYEKGNRLMINFAQYLNDEWKDKKNFECPEDFSSWPILSDSDLHVAHQTNGYDCGVFCCIHAEYAARQSSVDFTQDDIDEFRLWILHRILSCG